MPPTSVKTSTSTNERPVTDFVLTFSCPDQSGIVAKMSTALAQLGANIIDNHQFGDASTNTFCMRTRFASDHDLVEVIRATLDPIAQELAGQLSIRATEDKPRLAIMVSKHDHCLIDLVYRWRAGELGVQIPLVISNHLDLGEFVESFGIEFRHIPVTANTKQAAEDELRATLEEFEIDLVVLARYMQILSNELCTDLAGRAINIHHSFLPGFKGAKPYHQAWDRGVKLIGATAHYVTADLDEGPIIDQDVERVTHAQSAQNLVVIGKDIERVVLSRAVKAHAEGRVFMMGDRTIVFS